MSRVIQLALPAGLSFAELKALTALAEESGVAAIRLTDSGIDPSVLSSYLAGIHSGLNWVVEIPTTHNAPYNVARRVLSLDRATGGRVGVALLPGAGDEVSDATIPNPGAADPALRWAEYARVLTRLWESFPREALIGDQEAALVVDEELIRPIDHDGVFYRVAGPLDGPSSVQGRPVVVADLGVLDPATVAESADVVVVDRESAIGADAALTEALRRVGRSREDIVLLGRVTGGPDPELRAWAEEHRLDGFELAEANVLREWATQVIAAPTLRAAFGLREVVLA